ncbi:MAG: GGDEF domain-containing protein [Myxococcota bacterium]|nr:GGDEF domain-containing protein [Myxococcota bacterium]
MTAGFHIASAVMLGFLIVLPTLVRWTLRVPIAPVRPKRDQELLDHATQILAGSLVVDAPLLRNLRDQLARELPLLHLAIWDDAHQVSTGPTDGLGPATFEIPLPARIGEVQVWLTQYSSHRRSERLFHGLMPWLQAALRSSKAFQRTQFEALTDPLTGLGNRRMIHVERRKHAERGGAFGLLLLDLNDFKAINDTWDHHVGDRALLRFTKILQTCTRHSDTVIRLGGDEFLIIANDTDAAGMEMLAHRIGEVSEELQLELPNGQHQRISSAYGWSCYPSDGEEWEGLIAKADQRMYAHKALQKVSVA